MSTISIESSANNTPSNIVARNAKKFTPTFFNEISNPQTSYSKARQIQGIKISDTPLIFLGKIAHAVLKIVFSLNMPISKRGPSLIEHRVFHLWNELNTFHRQRIFGTPEDEKRYRLYLIRVLENYVANTDLTIQPLFLDDHFEINLKNGSILSGRIDRADQIGMYGMKIIDYKFGKPFYRDIELLKKKNIQLSWYAVIVKNRFPHIKWVVGEYHYLVTNEVIRMSFDEKLLIQEQERITTLIKDYLVCNGVKKNWVEEKNTSRIGKLNNEKDSSSSIEFKRNAK